MDASESSAATVEKNDGLSAEAVLDDSKNDGDVNMMQKNQDKSTSAVIDEVNVKKAISFLRNQQIEDVSPSEKRKYLESKGISQDEIDTALDRMASTTRTQGESQQRHEGRSYRHHHQQQNQYGAAPNSPGPLHHYENGLQPPRYSDIHNNNGPNYDGRNFRPDDGVEPSLFSFSSWAGGFCMSTVCLAALRWLNGGDFVLFPPPVVAEHIKQDNGETQHEGDVEDETDDIEESSSNSLESGDPELSMILNGDADIGSNEHESNEEQSPLQDLVTEVRALSTTINSLREEQDRANRAAAAQIGKGVTDDAMDFLRQQKPKKGDPAAIEKKDISRIASLISEINHEISQVKDALDDKTKEDGKDEDAEKSDHDELSRKIDIAIGKAKEILALVQSSDESSVGNAESQPAPSSDHANTLKESGQDPNGTAHEQAQESDNDEIKSGPIPPDQDNSPDGDNREDKNGNDDLEEALKKLSQNNGSEDLKVGAQMLYLYCKNLSKNPTVPRYRKIYTNNNSFKNKVGNLVGATDFLSALGFVERKSYFEWAETSSDTTSQLDFALVALELLQKGQPSDGSDTSEEKYQSIK